MEGEAYPEDPSSLPLLIQEPHTYQGWVKPTAALPSKHCPVMLIISLSLIHGFHRGSGNILLPFAFLVLGLSMAPLTRAQPESPVLQPRKNQEDSKWQSEGSNWCCDYPRWHHIYLPQGDLDSAIGPAQAGEQWGV